MFRIGTTSYILPDEILPNVEFLGPQVEDVELVLFETDEYGSNLPDAADAQRLRSLAARHGLTYTIHLPLDLRLGDVGSELDLSLRKARRVIDATLGLDPFAYVVHLDGRSLERAQHEDGLAAWQKQAQAAVEIVAGWLPDPRLLSIENIEAWDPEAFAPIVEALPVSRTIDIGHLWLRGMDAATCLERWIDRARVIHLHGIATRDHASLAHVPDSDLDPVVALLAERFTGVVTLEIFNQDDLASSLDALRASLARRNGR